MCTMRHTCIEINDNALDLPWDGEYTGGSLLYDLPHDCCMFWGDDSPSPRGVPDEDMVIGRACAVLWY